MKRLLNSEWPTRTIAGLQFGIGFWCMFLDFALGLYIMVLSFFPLGLSWSRRQGFISGWGAARIDTIALMGIASKNDWRTEQFVEAVNAHDREMMKATMTRRDFNRIDAEFDRQRAASDGSHDSL